MLMYKILAEDSYTYYEDLFIDNILLNIQFYFKYTLISVELISIEEKELQHYRYIPDYKCYQKIRDK